jgi:hypothetical protein
MGERRGSVNGRVWLNRVRPTGFGGHVGALPDTCRRKSAEELASGHATGQSLQRETPLLPIE